MMGLIDVLTKISAYLFKFLLFIYMYFTATYQSMIVIGIFILFDFITGIWKAKRLNQPITSKKMRNTIGKGCAYMIAILVAHLFELTFSAGVIPMMKLVAFFIASAEIKSIFENLGTLTGLDFWTFIKERLSGTNKKDDEPKAN